MLATIIKCIIILFYSDHKTRSLAHFYHVWASKCCHNNGTLHIRRCRCRGELSGVCDHKEESSYEVLYNNQINGKFARPPNCYI